jgi:hypothetical protein
MVELVQLGPAVQVLLDVQPPDAVHPELLPDAAVQSNPPVQFAFPVQSFPPVHELLPVHVAPCVQLALPVQDSPAVHCPLEQLALAVHRLPDVQLPPPVQAAPAVQEPDVQSVLLVQVPLVQLEPAFPVQAMSCVHWALSVGKLQFVPMVILQKPPFVLHSDAVTTGTHIVVVTVTIIPSVVSSP